MTNFYTTGGDLLPNAPSYVPRQADTDLYHALKQGEFCYILNSRQMGKSSLTIRVANRLREEGRIVGVFELSGLGSQVTLEQWYDGLVLKIGQQLNLSDELDDFWYDHDNLGFAQRLEQALCCVVLGHYQQPVVICFDEIDCVRSLPFTTDDFFATIRCCYNQRAQNPDLQRLTFCLVGTARPTDLITDAQATPFDIGQAIELTGFTFDEARPLAQGLQGKASNPETVLRAILEWTGGQPFLTQKVCDLFCRHTDAPLASGQETAYVEQVIQTHIIEHWEDKDDPPHLSTIRNRLIKRDNRQYTWQLLGLCRYILSQSQLDEMIEAHEMELRLTGLMVKQPGGRLQVFNKIYEHVFNQDWLAQAQCETLADNPYLGLSAFQAEDAQRFFGREQLSKSLLEKCLNLESAQLPRLLPILGPSGSGKSSLARAGLMPALQGSLKNVHVEIFTPTDAPLKELARIVFSIQGIDSIEKIDEIEQLLRTEKETLFNQVATLNTRLVLLIDQFEEVYTLCENAADGTAFIDNLITAVQSKPGLLVILTLRSDFLGATQRHGLLNQIIASQAVIVPMMSESELREAIAKPAEQVGHALDLGTVDLLVEQAAGREGALPLLQFALSAVWAGLRQGVEPSETLRQIGGVGGALAGKAENIYQGLSAVEKRVARRAFLKLIQLGEGTKDTRRRVKMRDMVAHGEDEKTVHAILSQFAQKDARLVTLSQDKQDHKTAEVTHEALLDNWQTLKGWLADSREDLRFEHRLNDAINNWENQRRADGLLWRSPDLDLLEKYYQQARQDMTAGQLGFYQASARKQEQTEQLKRVTFAVLVGLTAALGIGVYFAVEQKQKATEAAILAQKERDKAKASEKQADIARIQAEKSEEKSKEQAQIAFIEKLAAKSTLAAQLPSVGNGYYEQALLLAIQVFKEQNNGVSRSALLRAVQAQPQHKIKNFLYGHSDSVESVAFSPDGKTLASGSYDKTVRLWEVATRQPLGQPLVGHSDSVSSLAFSPDGKTLASGSWDKTMRLWDVVTRQPLGQALVGHSSWVESVAFSSDGKTIASGSLDKTLRLWEVATRQPLGQPLVGHSSWVESVAFSHDGAIIASGSRDHTIRLWEVATRQPLGEALVGHSSWVESVAFSPNGAILASGSRDDTVRLWEVATRQALGQPLVGHSQSVSSVVFSFDGKTLASASDDKTVRLWDVASKQALGQPLVGHSESLSNVAFSPDGKILASGSVDQTVRLWNVASKQALDHGQPLFGHSEGINSAAFSPDGQTLALGSGDNTVRLWDVATRQPFGQPLFGHSEGINSVAFSFDGKTLASGSDDKTVRLWEVATRQPLGEPLVGHSSQVTSVALSFDGKTLASGSSDNTVRLWEVATRQPLGEPLVGHSEGVSSVAFSYDGKILASGSSDDTVRLWDVATRQPLGEPLVGHSEGVSSVAFSYDGKILASGSSDDTVRLWDVATRQPLGEPLVGHSEGVSSVAFSYDGKIFASGSSDETVRLWDVATRQPLGEPLVGHSQPVNSVAFSPDGKILASGSDDKSVRLWDVNPESWVKKACAIVNRNFSHKEWEKYMGKDRPHEKTCPDLPKDTLGAIELAAEARKLLKEGKITEAKPKFAQAREWDNNVVWGDEGL
jgi:WD40 repeat protein/energy-coupling factor transporter ATP-binding protein EcfA2/Tfp pilus assembly protein PilN